MAEEVDSPDRYPLGDVQVSVMVKAGVVGMDEPSILPAGGALSHGQVVRKDLFSPGWVIPKVNDHFIVLVQQGDPRM
jgi:hypothetical protein